MLCTSGPLCFHSHWFATYFLCISSLLSLLSENLAKCWQIRKYCLLLTLLCERHQWLSQFPDPHPKVSLRPLSLCVLTPLQVMATQIQLSLPPPSLLQPPPCLNHHWAHTANHTAPERPLSVYFSSLVTQTHENNLSVWGPNFPLYYIGPKTFLCILNKNPIYMHAYIYTHVHKITTNKIEGMNLKKGREGHMRQFGGKEEIEL